MTLTLAVEYMMSPVIWLVLKTMDIDVTRPVSTGNNDEYDP